MKVNVQRKSIGIVCCFFVFYVALLSSAQILAAQDPETWQPSAGPPGGSVLSFATFSDNILLSGTNKGVFLSQDNGVSWIPRSEAYIADSVRALLVTQSGAIMAGTNEGLYRSSDAGISWDRIDTGLDALSFSSFTAGGNSLFAGGTMGMLRSMDDGLTWELSNDGLRDSSITTLEYTQEGDVLAGTREGVFQWVQLSNDWRETSNGLNKISDRVIYTIKRFDNRRLIAGTASGMFISDADFIEWNPLIGLLDDDREARIIDLAITQEEAIYAATPQVVYFSTDEGINWTPLPRGLPPIDPDLQSLNTLHLGSNEDLFTGTAYYGMYKYVASIDQWEASRQGLATLSAPSMIVTPFGDLLAGTQIGLFTSTDLGQTWSHTLVLENLEGFDVLHQDEQQRLFANGSSLLISTDQGTSWTSIHPDRANALVVLEDNTIITNPAFSNRMLRSTNDGETWVEVGTIPSQAAQFVVHDLLEDISGRLLAATEEGLFRSSDQGVTWENIPLGDTAFSTRSLAVNFTGRTYVGGFNGLYRSDETGENFELIREVASPIQKALIYDDRKYIIITSEDGIFRSVDAGVSWSPLNDGLPDSAELIAGVLDASIQDAVSAYVSVKGKGVYRGEAVIFLSNEIPDASQDATLTSFPNPFSNTMTLFLNLLHPDHVRIEVYDVLGREIHTLLDAILQPGPHDIQWDAADLPAGGYFILVTQTNRSTVRSVIKAK